jgi:PAS domain S-box-containing protein
LARFDFTLIDLNNSFRNFFGYSPAEGRKLEIREIFADESDFDYFQNTLKTSEQIKDFEVVLINKDGVKKWCLLNCVFIPDQSSDFCCYQGIIHDITLRKKAEKNLIEAERLSMTGKMARIVAHEIRNPLTNLNLALEHLKDEMLPANESVRLYSDIIQRNANRIEHLIGEMLNSSKPKELQLDLAAVNTVVNETISLAIDRINLKEIKLKQNFAENLPRILVDKEKIKIALLNIIINAVEAMTEREGTLFIRTNQENNTIVISISDNGKGISSEEMDKLFEPFFTAKPSGLGLGLTSTKNILDSHNADIHVMSELGKGTTFNVLFKLAE